MSSQTAASRANRPISRRAALRVAAAGLLGVAGSQLLLACQPAPPPTPTPAPKPAAPVPAAPTAAAKEAPKPAAPPSGQVVTVDANIRMPPSFVDWYKQWLPKFEQQHPDIKVNFQPVPPAEYDQKLQVSLAAGTPGDIIWTNNASQMHFYSAQGVLLPMEDLAKANNFDLKRIYPEANAYNTYEGKLYGLPWLSHPGISALFVNADGIDKAGIKLDDNWTYDDVFKIAQQLTEPGKRFGMVAPFAVGRWETPMLSFGGDILSKDLSKPAVQEPATIEAFAWIGDLMNKNKIAPTSESLALENAQQQFSSGKALMMFAGYWEISTVIGLVKDFKWRAMPIPVGKFDRFAGYSANDNYTIPKQAKQPQKAFVLIDWLLGHERSLSMVQAGLNPSGQPKVNDDPVLEQMPPNRVQAHKIIIKQMASGKYKPSPNPKNQRQIELRTVVTSELEAIWTGKKTAAQAMKDAELKVADVIGKPLP
ncbi:MAG: sugar ABC transporter substrate-binding protein [Chloroflexi bacterium]|nr:sugar ABC transporter substrate-binding protein [Chloroflexota bacterium]